jgi:hypothetical protein
VEESFTDETLMIIPGRFSISLESQASVILLVCGHMAVRMLNLNTLGRYFDDGLISKRWFYRCVNCDPDKSRPAGVSGPAQ